MGDVPGSAPPLGLLRGAAALGAQSLPLDRNASVEHVRFDHFCGHSLGPATKKGRSEIGPFYAHFVCRFRAAPAIPEPAPAAGGMASARRRPKTQASDELRRGDRVWDDDLGWGVVLDDVGSGCTSGVSVTLDLRR